MLGILFICLFIGRTFYHFYAVLIVFTLSLRMVATLLDENGVSPDCHQTWRKHSPKIRVYFPVVLATICYYWWRHERHGIARQNTRNRRLNVRSRLKIDANFLKFHKLHLQPMSIMICIIFHISSVHNQDYPHSYSMIGNNLS